MRSVLKGVCLDISLGKLQSVVSFGISLVYMFTPGEVV